MDASLASNLEGTVTSVVSSFSSILSWWFIPVVVSIFGASIAIGLILRFFNKRRGRRK